MADVVIPVSKIRRAKPTPKGRAVDPVAGAPVGRRRGGAPRQAPYQIEKQQPVQESFGHEDIPGRRLASMLASGLARLDADAYVLTGKGRALARVFSLAERLAGLPRGG